MKISETMNSKSYFFDTYAIIELIKGNSKYEFLKESIIITSSMNLAEVYYALLLENKKEVVDSIMNMVGYGGRVKVLKYSGSVVDVGNEDDLERAKQALKP